MKLFIDNILKRHIIVRLNLANINISINGELHKIKNTDKVIGG